MVTAPNADATLRMRVIRWVIITAVLLGSIVVVSKVWPIGPDYYFTFHRTAEKWLLGETHLYDDNPTVEVPGNPDIGYFSVPWLLIILVPLALLSLQLGQAVLTVGTIVGIVLSIHAFSKIRPIPIFALA